ncbi:LLM class flavin-dependent oxidoreductase [Fictibacillus gelatini]|uniref:LLM class flavin-dependent oxidoreductase n=1 Tax=Fictibacillus gelatini TaxID=225985 RepID=UPI00041152C4|nr:LLM class flavin-dependent oxidoreductase [Fictibacillus gelatini]
MLTLSVLDQSPVSFGSTPREAVQNTVRLAQETEKMGYHRFWVAEHHHTKNFAGSTPEVLISHLAAKTSTIRVGSGGVMLPHYSSYKVAENFRMLETLYPGRIDLGIGRAPGGMPLATMALQEGNTRGIHHYPQQVDDLIAYLHNAVDENHRFCGLEATPIPETAPEIWMLGSSGSSARLAAEKGIPFTFAHFINGIDGPAVAKAYREAFQPSSLLAEPKVIAAIFAICADTEEQAERIASSLDLSILMLEKGERRNGVPSIEQALNYPYTTYDLIRIRENRKRMIVGAPEQVKQQVLQLSNDYETDELMVVTITHDFNDKLNSYQLLSEMFPQKPSRD